MNKGKFMRNIAIALGAIWLLVSPAIAFQVQPLRYTLEPASGRTSTSFVVVNTKDKPLPFEVRMEKRVIDEQGGQTFLPAEQEFVVFPVQGLVPPGSSQSIRVQYVGDPVLEETAGYVVRVAEVPVTDDEVSGIQFAYSFGAALYVKPAGAKARVMIETAKASQGQLVLDLFNSGNDFSLLTRKRLRFSVGGERFSFGPDELRDLIADPLMAPNSRRRLEIGHAGIVPGPVTEYSFE